MLPTSTSRAWLKKAFPVLLLSLTACVGSARAAIDERVVALKASFVLNFARYTTWSEKVLPSGAPLIVGVAGDAETVRMIATQLNGKDVRGHAVEVRPLAVPVDPSVRIAYLTQSLGREERHGLTDSAPRGVLWVADAPDFAATPPGVIAFFERDGKVRFRVNLEHAKQQELQLSSRLASLAELVTH